MMVVTFDNGRVGQPRLLFEGPYLRDKPFGRQYDLSPDGKRFLMFDIGATPPPAPTQLNVVLNWFEELTARAGR
jgi:hypothetical protein